MINEIIPKIMDFLPEESRVWVYFILLMVFCYKPVGSFIGELRKKKANRLKEALNEGKDYLDEASTDFIRSNLSEYYFKQAVGLDISAGFREALMKLYQKDNSPVSWQNFRRVIDYMEYKDGRIIKVHIPWIIEVVGIGCVSFGMALAVKTSLISHQIIEKYKIDSISDLMVLLLIMVICAVFVLISMVFVLRPYLIYQSAKLVNRHIQKDNLVGNEADKKVYVSTCFYEKSILPYSQKSIRWYRRFYQMGVGITALLVFRSAFF